MNGLLALGLRQMAEPSEPGVRPRASALIGRAVLTIERALHDWRRRGAPRLAEPPPLSDVALLASRYAKAYLSLIALGRESGVPVALATSSLAVNESSPREVKGGNERVAEKMFEALLPVLAKEGLGCRVS
jgi:hypothetical protein